MYTLTSDQPRTSSRNITYRTKSNSTNAVISLTTAGLYTIRQAVHTFAYTLSITNQYTSNYEVSVTVAGYNKLAYVTVFGIIYEKVASVINPPYYLSSGYISDFSGTIPDTSGATGITIMGTIFVGMT